MSLFRPLSLSPKPTTGVREIWQAVFKLVIEGICQPFHAVAILDRFHIVQWMNRAVNEVRRNVFGAAPKDELGRTMKVKKWMLICTSNLSC